MEYILELILENTDGYNVGNTDGYGVGNIDGWLVG